MSETINRKLATTIFFYRLFLVLVFAAMAGVRAAADDGYLFHDSHFHLTNYIQRGTDIRKHLHIMGDKVGRSTLFGIPLQQSWAHRNTGDIAPNFYLESDAPLYYYSFTDAQIAMAYLSLTPAEKRRFDPMITGFNPADMYAVEHIERVLKLFPGVFSGIGEFTIHKEFVSAKIAGDSPSLTDPALDRLMKFAAEVGLIVLVHCDMDMPFQKPDEPPVYLRQMKELMLRNPKTTIIWAHLGLGRTIRPVQTEAEVDGTMHDTDHLKLVRQMVEDARFDHVYFDISWEYVAQFAVATPDATGEFVKFANAHSDRLLFGTDNVAPPSQNIHLKVYHLWDPVWSRLTPEASENIRKKNYERLFDAAQKRVRAWERKNTER
jgi:hypothetical protein